MGFIGGSIGALEHFICIEASQEAEGALLGPEYRKYPGLVNNMKTDFRKISGDVRNICKDCLSHFFSFATNNNV